MSQLFSFTARCPKCERARAIETYNRGELLRLLDLGYPIEARCTECDVRWPIAPEVRAYIALWRRIFQPAENAPR